MKKKKSSQTDIDIRPEVILKWAASLDGRVATRTGESKYLTGEAARKEVHRLRASVDAVLVGSGTAVQDDPELTVRLVRGQTPLRVVFDRRLRISLNSKLVRTSKLDPVWIYSTPLDSVQNKKAAQKAARLKASGVRIIALSRPKTDLSFLKDALTHLFANGVKRLLVEGGPTLLGQFWDADFVDEVYAYFAPMLIGGQDAFPIMSGLGLKTINGRAQQFGHMRLKKFPRENNSFDLRIRAEVVRTDNQRRN